ncbi:LppU family putative lipoprotein [Nocardia blacklockiae]|uniref:LppU family putative lipoprotein n=1 Tax=Nocardia blacklockiae TaxID=480036 RepID=UPI001893FA54|nr:hypothetical protein [Nocardia blacklockiae]MBF6176429.1 hypothetical protein [Nocardia blacklockiae]
MSRRRIHAGFTLAGFVIAAALSTACLAAAVLSLMGDDEPAPARTQAATSAAPATTSAEQPGLVLPGPPPSSTEAPPSPAGVVNKDAAPRKDPAAIELNVGDCVAFGGGEPAVSKIACGTPGSSYKVVDKADPAKRCPTDVDRSYSEPAPAPDAAAAGSLCLDINWVVGGCMDMTSDTPKPIDCAARPPKAVRVVEIKQGTANVNDCSSGDRGFVYNQRKFVVCVASLS